MNNEQTTICMICYKPAQIMAYGNSYCKTCFEQSPYYMERQAKINLEAERKTRGTDPEPEDVKKETKTTK